MKLDHFLFAATIAIVIAITGYAGSVRNKKLSDHRAAQQSECEMACTPYGGCSRYVSPQPNSFWAKPAPQQNVCWDGPVVERLGGL